MTRSSIPTQPRWSRRPLAGGRAVRTSICNRTLDAGGRRHVYVLFPSLQADGHIGTQSLPRVRRCSLSFSSRRRHTRSLCDWSSDVCSSDLFLGLDRQMLFQKHIEAICSKTKKLLFPVLKAVRQRYGISRTAVHTAYQSILLPMLTYGDRKSVV